ncbi:MAG: asparagine synthase (glutamine-hydrolyzing) [Bacteroidales bacterium]|nr:asparagine synthase (glutamine-hydrolyzing) [Bacteroidales bacterium]
MCGITGIVALTDKGKSLFNKIDLSVKELSKRGPDGNGTFKHNRVALGHARLAVIDTTDAAAQPFTDNSGRYTIALNGEFFNYKEHRKQLSDKGFKFRSQSDTEVLLQLYINEGVSCLEKINGFFAFAIYDNVEESLFIARDRIGIKPLLIYRDEDKFLFASEMKALLSYGIPKDIDDASLYTYLQLNYIPNPYSIFKNVRKLDAGSFLMIQNLKNQGNAKIEQKTYYRIPEPSEKINISYTKAQNKLEELMNNSVELRLISDVPLGVFLSGGIDSSIITAIASRYKKNINTFSIGYKDEPYFDETYYAKLVSDKFKTNHTVFSLTNDDLFSHLHRALDYIDEPFADSSALAVNILGHQVRKHVTVALSGDGGDEMFAGYNKHRAEYFIQKNKNASKTIGLLKPLLNALPQSRNSVITNKIRQFNRFANGIALNAKERYWLWCGFSSENKTKALINNELHLEEYFKRKCEILKHIDKNNVQLYSILYTDMNLVLKGDMLTKTDMMSMANSLEVRVPFLDYNVVNYAFSLPEEFKIDKKHQKKILKDTYRKYLPDEIYSRKKHGFEVPLLKWLRTDLKSMLEGDLLNDSFVKEQGIFNVSAINNMKNKLFSSNPGDVHAQIWGLVVFQYWWKKYMN